MTASDLIAKVKNLAPISHSALKLVGLLDQPAISNEDIVQVLKFDSVLTAKLLRACNSPFFGLEEPVASVEQAVLMLGHQQILHIALSIAFSSNMAAPLPGHAEEAEELWQHSLVSALAAENLAKTGSAVPVQPAVAFTAGLLHDIGKVVMNHALIAEAESDVRLRIAQDERPRVVVEAEILGVDHAEVGRCLMVAWRLPGEIVEAVGNHHHPICQPRPKLSALVHVADSLAHRIVSNLGWESFVEQTDAEAVAALGIDEDRFHELMAGAQEAISHVENLVQFA